MITLKSSPLTEEQISDKNELHFIIVAKLNDVIVDTTVFVATIKAKQYEGLPHIFDKSVNRGSISTDLNLNLDPIILDADVEPDIDYELIEGDFALFKFEKTATEIFITLVRDLENQDIVSKTNLHFVIVALDGEKNVIDRTVVVLDLPRELCRQAPVFEKPLYNGEVVSTLDGINVESIKLTPASNRQDVTFVLDSNCKWLTFKTIILEI